MAAQVQVLTRPPLPAIDPQAPVTLSVKSYLDTELEKYIQKQQFTANAIVADCYVIDGGNALAQPCDD